ncbi:LysM peptidoglycan-binding domain-containing protein [Phenylobacterium kunshanense]|uniref:Peptidase M24 n=1 Tax=Phenylobacterium kunshanense TaxID=1445034 RepID=A0A328B7Z7_9CAUL|nr:LysM peptidoglycan-binding domain-containing protein [Phenylobacterium kunshanense]RAK62046.1 peptidase M24 [Phenylobacterium kunshanense]
MPPHFERTALILLAGTALTACASPQYPITAPLVQLPPPAAAPASSPSPTPQMAAAPEAPAVAAPIAPVETATLAPLAPARPAPSMPDAAATTPPTAMTPPAVDAATRSRSRGPAATYTVKKGDTLAKIADKLGTDIQDLAKANGLKSPYRINPGQVLKNPKAPAPARRTTSRAERAEDGAGEGGRTYTVQAGDTLFGIAMKFGTTVDALREANGISGSGLMRGRTLKIPGGGADAAPASDAPETVPGPKASSTRAEPAPEAAPAEPSDSRTVTTRQVTGRVVDISVPGQAYKVKSGDNLERIARRLDSDVEELAKINKLKKPYRLQPGQTIRGPGSSAKGYVVGRGDTLALIARRFDVTVEELRAANGLRRGASVAPGRRLKLPSGYRDKGPIVTRSTAPAERPEAPAPKPPSSFDTPPPAGQRLPPPRSAPRPPEVEGSRLPSRPQPYQPSGPIPGAPVASPPVSDAQIMEMGRGRFAWPIRGELISSYGARGPGQRNDGVNIRANAGDPVRASAAGDVVYAGDQVPGFGNLVLIKHADGWVTAYGHLGRVNVRMQQRVEQGQEIGQAGSSGGVSEPQLHFEVRYAPTPQERARPVDPALVLPR